MYHHIGGAMQYEVHVLGHIPLPKHHLTRGVTLHHGSGARSECECPWGCCEERGTGSEDESEGGNLRVGIGVGARRMNPTEATWCVIITICADLASSGVITPSY